MPGPSPAPNSPRRPPGYRFHHRSRSHDAAHSDSTDAQPAEHPPVEHPLAARGAAALVTEQHALADLIGRLRAAGSFAYDSEFIGELTYAPKLCLIQVATAGEIALLDPLAQIDLTPFWELICDPAVEKVVHAGQQDVEPVFRIIKRPPANLFDTQIAGGFIGLGYPLALSKLVKELTGAKLGKGLTFTHWDQRPLSGQQLRYAADDVRYLPACRAEMGRRLNDRGFFNWASEECRSLADAALYQFDPDTAFLRVRGAVNLPPSAMAVVRELTIWRDATARAEDVPPRSLLKDEILLDLARNPVRTVDALARIRGLPRPVEEQYGAELVAVTQKALSLPKNALPAARNDEPTPTEKFRADALWATAQCLCAGRGIDPAVVTSRQEIGEFFRSIDGNADVSGLRLMNGWRKEALGEPLMRIHRGEATIKLTCSQGNLRAEESLGP